jgi:hypothetical protein
MFVIVTILLDRLCNLVIRVPGYRSRGHWFDCRRYQIFWEVVGPEWRPLSLVRITEELLEWKSSGSGCRKSKINGRGDPLRWPCNTLYLQKLALTSPTGGGRSVGIVCLRTKVTEFSLLFYYHHHHSDVINCLVLYSYFVCVCFFLSVVLTL